MRKFSRRKRKKGVRAKWIIVAAIALMLIIGALSVLDGIKDSGREADIAIKRVQQSHELIKELELQLDAANRENASLRELNQLLLERMSTITDEVSYEWEPTIDTASDEVVLHEPPGMDVLIPGALIGAAELIRQVVFRVFVPGF